ncbi:MAG: hypothetical protein HOY71_09105 [Nonomuraea sp.]|nr:hypothetical protein [Nonomuraea sp.]
MATALIGLLALGIPDPALATGWGTADRSVSMSVQPGRAQPGRPILYQVRVRNDGPGDAVLPVLTVTMPRGVQIVGVNVGNCRQGRGTNEIVCSAADDVLVGQSGTLVISGTVRPGASGPLRASASISSEIEDSDVADNTVLSATPLDAGADLGIRLREGSGGLTALVRNRGPRLVRDARVYLNAGRARLISAVHGRCRDTRRFVACRLRPLAAGQHVRLGLALRGAGRTVSAGVVSATYGDRRPGDNLARLVLGARRRR